MLEKKISNISIRLAGGLGNQLFQFAAAYHLSQIIDCKKIYIDTRFLSRYEEKRDFHIGFIIKYFDNCIIGEVDNWFSSLALKFRLPKILDRSIGNYSFITSIPHLQKEINNKNHASHFLLDGYFQHPDIILGEKFRRTLKDLLYLERKELIDKVKNNRKCTAIHIRRGDYVTSDTASKVFRTIPIGYYHEALKGLPRTNQIIVFSDDQKLSAEFAAFLGGVDARQLDLSLEDEFCLLMACDDYIIANSTFSWWAAYLGCTAGSRVISPASWYVSKLQSSANPLLLPNFELIEA